MRMLFSNRGLPNPSPGCMYQNFDVLKSMVSETYSEFVARCSAQDISEKARLAASYPCLVETRIPSLPTTLDSLRDALEAFVASLGMPYEVDAGDILVYGRTQTVRIDLTDVNAVACRRRPEQQESVESGNRAGHGEG